MASGAAKNRMLEEKTFSRKNDAQSVANGERWPVEIELRQCDIC